MPLQWLKDNYKKQLVHENDTFYESDCFKCGAQCCYDTIVILQPYDIWRIMHNQAVTDMLGIKTTRDLYTANNSSGLKLFEYTLSRISNMPIASIKMLHFEGNTGLCPFAAPVLKDKPSGNSTSDSPHIPEYMTAANGNLSLKCLLEEAKPAVCRTYPLVKIGTISDDNVSSEIKYLITPNENCVKFRNPDKKMTIREYIAKYDLETLYKMQDLALKWERNLAEKIKDENIRHLFGTAVYDFDIVGLHNTNGKMDMDIIKKSRPQSFEKLLDACEKTIDVFNIMQLDKKYAIPLN